MQKLIGKSFLVDDEEWVLEEILLYEHRCVCRSYYSDRTKQFYCDYVKNKILKYEDDLKELEKDRNSIVIREESEKELLKKIIQYYNDNVKLSEISTEELKVLSDIKTKFSVK